MKPATILCIEDNADNMMLLNRVFRIRKLLYGGS